MVEECSETRIHGRFGWKAIPFAREDFDSNLVSILGEVVEVMVGYWQGASAPGIGNGTTIRPRPDLRTNTLKQEYSQ
jgi:hypothetical protein